MSPPTAFDCHRLSSVWTGALSAFFADLELDPDSAYFHPHPLDRATAERLCHYTGRDMYYVVGGVDTVDAYGMLRGWDAGFDVPSLGIAVRPSRRGAGLGRGLMSFLHTAAAGRGATRVRLTVEPANAAALNLYRNMGYCFKSNAGGDTLIGYRTLGDSQPLGGGPC